MLSKKTKYAINALILLAKKYKQDEQMQIQYIAEREKIPRKFLETILLELRKHGILGSKRGPSGGYYLLKHPEEVMLSTVIRLTDGPIALTPCASLNFYEPCAECKNEVTCALRHVTLEVRESAIRILSKTSLADLIAIESRLEKKHPEEVAKPKAKKSRL
jgi:Rrf2 family protein